MASETLYAGPAKVYRGTTGFFPEGENGESKFDVDQEKLPIVSGMHGLMRYQQGDATGKISYKPFDNWGLLGAIFPPYLGVKVGTTAAALAIGTKLAGLGAVTPAKVWVPVDQRLYTAVCTYLSKLPQMHLGTGHALYDGMELGCIGDPTKSLGDAAFLHSITESSAADPGGVMTMDDFVREAWTLSWGGAGLVGLTLQAEEEFVLVPELKVNVYKVQKLSRMVKLASISFMVKGRIIGATHTQIDTAIGVNAGRHLGSSFGASGFDATLTSTSGKTITLKNADAVGTGFEFGGTKLGTGETGFVNAMTLTAGAPNSLLEFSV